MSRAEINLNDYPDDLIWLKAKKDADVKKFSFFTKVKQKFLENPFIPIGLLVTTFILADGIRHFKNRNTVLQQKRMRGRIYGQAFTFISFIAGSIYFSIKNNSK